MTFQLASKLAKLTNSEQTAVYAVLDAVLEKRGENSMEYEYGYWTAYESTKERRARMKKEYREYINRINAKKRRLSRRKLTQIRLMIFPF